MRLPEIFHESLCQPGRPETRLLVKGNHLVPSNGSSGTSFPLVDGAPILIDEERSIFRVADYVGGNVTTMDLREESLRYDSWSKRFKRTISSITPDKSRSISDFSADDAVRYILERRPEAKILVIGAGDARFSCGANESIVYTDVALAPDTHLIADAHDIPFVDDTFDAVLAIAVLEHVMDPYRVVAEIQRVLNAGGFVFAATPFMQQVHMGPYDVTRFTHVGHRRLFRWFDEIRSGVANGPGMAVAWSLEYWIASWSDRSRTRNLLRTFARFLIWPFLLSDGWLAKKRGCYDCASAFYFFGSLRAEPVSDRAIVDSYRGLNR